MAKITERVAVIIMIVVTKFIIYPWTLTKTG